METGVAGALLQCVYSGSISIFDMEMERRPYHKNCTCALHSSKKNCSNLCPQRRQISVPTKQFWKECSLSLEGTHHSSRSSSSAVVSRRIEITHLGPCCMVEIFFFSGGFEKDRDNRLVQNEQGKGSVKLEHGKNQEIAHKEDPEEETLVEEGCSFWSPTVLKSLGDVRLFIHGDAKAEKLLYGAAYLEMGCRDSRLYFPMYTIRLSPNHTAEATTM
ncbi:hypothetical protein IFM89_018586 [Coptis chinensis]|uniref:Uncharacterized protein n=1 Tax=Coptis chinensis TaxID=261450 RepID=A0A835M8D1_9MAGN|nr:hypothetical protein IFM89_018586 [Coptis chinensis]